MTLAASSRGPNKTPSPPGTATQRVPNEAAQPRALNWSLAVSNRIKPANGCLPLGWGRSHSPALQNPTSPGFSLHARTPAHPRPNVPKLTHASLRLPFSNLCAKNKHIFSGLSHRRRSSLRLEPRDRTAGRESQHFDIADPQEHTFLGLLYTLSHRERKNKEDRGGQEGRETGRRVQVVTDREESEDYA
ncbi:hypothetical protein E2C01_090650 [Portunus trituberculatus]|uniref:Uncharacterized protein n=1 Tax=Portunus trituberculatus TaxID=210409 RepID=A0A5B7JQY3_PORTR|nr:hypothetical protein [Portunus trituberculatus]